MRIFLLLLCSVPPLPCHPPPLLPLLLVASSSSAPQIPFSPFSLLGSFFSSSPPWSRAPTTARTRKLQPKKIFFRPHLPVPVSGSQGQAFSASQQVPQILPFKSRVHPPVRPSRGSISSVSPTKIIRITSPSNFSSSFSSPVTSPARVHTGTKSVLTSILSNTVDTTLPSVHEQVEVVYPSNSGLTPEAVVTEQSIFSSYHSRESALSGPNHEDFPIISLIDQHTGHNYYDEVFHNGFSSPPVSKVPRLNVNPYYSAEEFNYNQDPIDLELVHGTGPRVRDVLINTVYGSENERRPEEAGGGT
jgi:hypothetical protein